MNKKIYIVDAYDRHCPENNNGDWVQAVFSTEELAQEYVDLNDPRDENGKRLNWKGLFIREFDVDLPLDKKEEELYDNDEDFDFEQFDEDIKKLKEEF